MKYCPYCGANLPDGAASFCMECGKSLPIAENGQKKSKEEIVRSQECAKKNRRKFHESSGERHKKVRGEHTESAVAPKDDGYDGYYDDVLPSDTGKLKEGVDVALIKKISAVAGVMLLIIILCVIAMYLL